MVNAPTMFFSYSRADAKFALKLANDLRSTGISLWIDQLDIPAGDRWDAAVENALKASPKLLVVLSPTSVKSQNVMDEVAFALENKKKILPVLYQRCNIPFRIQRLQYIDFTARYDDGFKKLLNELSVPIAKPDRPPINIRRFVYPSIILLLVIMVGIGLGRVYHRLYPNDPTKVMGSAFKARTEKEIQNFFAADAIVCDAVGYRPDDAHQWFYHYFTGQEFLKKQVQWNQNSINEWVRFYYKNSVFAPSLSISSLDEVGLARVSDGRINRVIVYFPDSSLSQVDEACKSTGYRRPIWDNLDCPDFLSRARQHSSWASKIIDSTEDAPGC